MFIYSFIDILILSNCNYYKFLFSVIAVFWHIYCSVSFLRTIYLVMRKVIIIFFGGVNMLYSKLKILFCLTVCLSILFAPFLLEISQDGKAYAFSSRSHNKSSNTKDKGTFGYTPLNDEPGNNNPVPAPVPEPATWLLIGAGAAGVAVLRKKFKKK